MGVSPSRMGQEMREFMVLPPAKDGSWRPSRRSLLAASGFFFSSATRNRDLERSTVSPFTQGRGSPRAASSCRSPVSSCRKKTAPMFTCISDVDTSRICRNTTSSWMLAAMVLPTSIMAVSSRRRRLM